MTHYCIELGNEPHNKLIHKLSCGSFDHGTLLGNGNIASLGNFGSSEKALEHARTRHPNAVRCLDCCMQELVSRPSRALVVAFPHEYNKRKKVYRSVDNGSASVRNFDPQVRIRQN